jgi:hypothetical protein
MKRLKKHLLFSFAALLSLAGFAQEIDSEGALGVGFAWTDVNYGLSGKYNFTDQHTGEVIIGSAAYGFGTNAFSFTGRYLYNFELGDAGFADFKPYLYGSAGYFTVKFEDPFGILTDNRFTTVTFGFGGGIEWTFQNFIEGLAFNLEAGYLGGSFDNGLGSFSGFTFGSGIHFYFDL